MTAKDKCSTKKQNRAKNRATESREKETSVIEMRSSDEAQEPALEFFLKKSLRYQQQRKTSKKGVQHTHICSMCSFNYAEFYFQGTEVMPRALNVKAALVVSQIF